MDEVIVEVVRSIDPSASDSGYIPNTPITLNPSTDDDLKLEKVKKKAQQAQRGKIEKDEPKKEKTEDKKQKKQQSRLRRTATTKAAPRTLLLVYGDHGMTSDGIRIVDPFFLLCILE